MHIATRPKAVVLGMTSKMPLAGIVFLTMQYVVGLKRLGFEVYYVEDHGKTPWLLLGGKPQHEGPAVAAAFIAQLMRGFGLEDDHWAFRTPDDRDQCFGLPDHALNEVLREADLVLNLHGGTVPRPEHSAGGRLVYVGTDPVAVEVALDNGDRDIVDFLAPHCAFFTWGENYGHADCLVPTSDRFAFVATRQPIVMDWWEPFQQGPAEVFSTVANWRQPGRLVSFRGETYHWSKHLEFQKFIDLPQRSAQPLELALVNALDEDRQLLTTNGWRVRDAATFNFDLEAYRQYVGQSRGEFTVAKEQNVRLRSGWFSDRSASYLACGRPVVTQETGFGNVLPTGSGLFGFSTLEESQEAIGRINADYSRHSEAARSIAREWFDYRVVLGAMLDALGCRPGLSAGRRRAPFPADLVLTPVSRWPTTLPGASVRLVMDTPVTERLGRRGSYRRPAVSIVTVTHDGLVFTRLCLESLLAGEPSIDFEVVVVDNASTDGTPEYLRELAALDDRVRVELSTDNAGFAAATNRGVALSQGDIIVLLNNDTMLVEPWLDRLVNHLNDPRIGLIGAVTNRAGNEAEIEAPYRTYGELQRFARDYARQCNGTVFDIRTATMFCAALRRTVWDSIGPLDIRFQTGLFEDDDFSMRVRRAGFRVACADDVFVHHFGQASIGRLAATGDYGALFHANRERWEEKWGTRWQPYVKRRRADYDALVIRVRDLVDDVTPPGATVLVLSKGDDELLRFTGRHGWHFPQAEDGSYAGHYPEDSAACIAELERLRQRGADFLLIPETGLWWLEHYAGFASHLERHYGVRGVPDAAGVIVALSAGVACHTPDAEGR
jgi:GT2 family glycosyltransferase